LHIILALFLLACANPCGARTAPPSDCAVLENLYSSVIRSLVESAGLPAGRKANLAFTRGLEPSERVRIITEAVLSARGLHIADNGAAGGYTMEIAITDARCSVLKNGRSHHRHCSLEVHVRWTDDEGNVLFAGGSGESSADLIPNPYLRTTDNAACFSGAVSRITSGGGPGKARILTFLVVSAALGYFAFR